MRETANAVCTPLALSPAIQKGRAKGALICAVFGSAWMLWAAVFAPTGRTASLIFVALVTVPLSGRAVLRVRAVRHYKETAEDRRRWATIAPLYWINTVAEWLLAAGVVFALAHFRRYSLIPQFLGVIIGLHFLALAKILREPRYYIMGTAMILLVIATLLIPEGSVRNVMACAGIGLPLWITAVVILMQYRGLDRAQ